MGATGNINIDLTITDERWCDMIQFVDDDKPTYVDFSELPFYLATIHLYSDADNKAAEENNTITDLNIYLFWPSYSEWQRFISTTYPDYDRENFSDNENSSPLTIEQFINSGISLPFSAIPTYKSFLNMNFESPEY